MLTKLSDHIILVIRIKKLDSPEIDPAYNIQ